MTPRRFVDRRVLVFGGASGMGAAVRERLVAEGANVVIADRMPHVHDVPDDPRQIVCDVRDQSAVETAVASASAQLGDLDVVVNTVGVHEDGTALNTSEAQWSDLIDVNLSGAFRIGRAVLPELCGRGAGVLIHVASDAGIVAWPGQVGYTAAKGGLVHLTRAQAVDAAGFGVRVNCVCPSFTDTPMIRRWAENQADPVEAYASAERMQPLGRLALAQDVAAVIAFLASDEAAYVTGVALPVDGGISAQ